MNTTKSQYKNAIDILTSQGKFYINLGLERVQKILELLGNPQDKLKYIHVAGTNGKGSVCAILSSILSCESCSSPQRGEGRGIRDRNQNIYALSMQPQRRILKVGLFTSPHVFEYTERIKINNVEITKEDFANGVNDIVKLADENDTHLTEFEILTVLSFNYFAQNNVDIVVLETGLGGRLDSTNVIKNPICSIITHIDFDHTERLGNTIEKIAFEKAGIIKENCPVVINKNNVGFNTIKEIANKKKSEIFVSSEAPNFLIENLALKGTYQKENLALALKAIEVLNQNRFTISQEQITKGLKAVKHPCRFEYIKEKNIIIDGAHNPDGTKALRESLDYCFPNQNFKFIFGCLKNKDYPAMMKGLFTPKDDIYFYEFDNQNTCKYADLQAVCENEAKPFSEFVQDKNTLTVICGSFYMLKELLTKLA